MVDLGDLARKASTVLSKEKTQAVLDALDNCVVYNINSPYRKEASGLSCYYPLDMDKNSLNIFKSIGTSEALAHYYEYNINGSLSAAGRDYLALISRPEPTPSVPVPPPAPQYTHQEIPTIAAAKLDNAPISINSRGNSVLNIGRQSGVLTEVNAAVASYSRGSGKLRYYGNDTRVDKDWQNGIFTQRFNGYWPALNGNFLYIEQYYESETYNLYRSPIGLQEIVNGRLSNLKKYILLISFDKATQKFSVLGSRKDTGIPGMQDKNLRQFKTGDQITTYTYETNLKFPGIRTQLVMMNQFWITNSLTLTIDWKFLPIGDYVSMFEMVDAKNNSTTSKLAGFTIDRTGGISAVPYQ
jgi:hypothetical protein